MGRIKGQTVKPKSEAEKAKEAAEKAKENRERWLGKGAARVSNVLSAIATLSQCANRKSFDFTKDEWAAARVAIETALDAVDKTFATALTAPAGVAVQTHFTFGNTKGGSNSLPSK